MTPEGKVKTQIRKILLRYRDLYTYWPVPHGYGPSSLDCIICIKGCFVAVEAKAPGGKPTARQDEIINRIRKAGGFVFVIDGSPESLAEFELFLKTVIDMAPRKNPHQTPHPVEN